MSGYIYRVLVGLIFIAVISLVAPSVYAADTAVLGSDEALISEADLDIDIEAPPKVAVAPWRLNAPPELAYLKAALTDMLSSRMGSIDFVEVIGRDVVNDAYGFYSDGLTGSTAVAFGRGIDADYVLYGSLSVLGEELSLDASLVDVEGGAAEAFFFKGRGMDSVVALTEELAAKVSGKLRALNVEVVEPQVDDRGVSYTGKFTAPESESGIIAPLEVSDEMIVAPEEPSNVSAPQHEDITVVDANNDEFLTKTPQDALRSKSSRRFKLGSGLFKDMEIFDLDGDGHLEIFAMKKAEIHILRVMEEGVIKRVKVVKSGGDIENISMSVFDADGDGSYELYISRIRGNVADSCVLTATSDGFAIKSCGIPYLIKSTVIDGQAMLLGQSFNREWGLKRKIHVLTVLDEGVTRGDALPLPRGAELYGVAYGDLNGDDTDELIAIDSRSRLRVYERESAKEWSQEWKSSDKFGGSLTTIEYGGGEDDNNGKEYFSLEGDIYAEDIDDDGGIEVVVKSNAAGGVFGKHSGRVKQFKGGVISAFGWDGSSLKELWHTKEIVGYIADFSVGDLDGDGITDLTVLVTEGTGFNSRNSESYILFHRLSI